MKIKRLGLSLLLITALLSSCEDALDKRDLNVVDDQLIWSTEVQATLYINNLYQDNMPGMSLGSNSGMSDENYASSESSVNILYGIYTSIDVDAIKELDKDKYFLIRRINIAIRGLENSPLPDEISGRIKAQALFLRAFRYWEMIRLYGGIPMVMRVQDPFLDETLDVERSKTVDAINMLIADLDEAIASLPVEWPESVDQGRITSGAAAAFKARILLTWASPLFNPDNKADRWQRAYDASSQAIDLLSQMTVPRDLHPDFSTIFTTDITSNVEAVIYKRYDAGVGTAYASDWESKVRPPSTGGNGGYNPTWEMVKAFPMANGLLISQSGSGYDSAFFWQNRDPRFYATVAYNGCEWDMQGRETGQRQWAYSRNIHELNRTPSTGFYCRKATDPKVTEANTGQTSTTWHELRYAEVLLTQAECANELGKTSEALQLVRRIRARAGIVSSDGLFGIADGVTKEQMRELIMVERQVEFAFENKRYWDLRRRLMFRNDLGEYVKKLNGTQRHGLETIVKSAWLRRVNAAKGTQFYGWNKIDTVVYNGHLDINNSESYNTYFTTNYKIMESQLNSVYLSFNYLSLYDFFAVSNSFLEHSPAVEQTLGWENGSFDPLAE